MPPKRSKPSRSRPKASAHRRKGALVKKGSAKRPNERKFMRMAIDEMMLSRSENPAKADPLVGAVLVDRQGQLLARAHRGKYSSGDHGEFSLFEKVGAKVPFGSTLYVTLEPCTKRNHPKIPCAERVIGAELQRVVIGIKDPNPDIYGQGVTALQNHGIHVGFFDEDLAEEVRYYNKAFLDEQERRVEAARTEPLQGPAREENRPVLDASLEDLSRSELQRYVKVNKLGLKVPSASLWKELKKSGFFKQSDAKPSLTVRVAGVIVFAKRPNQFLPQCTIKADHYPGSFSDGIGVGKVTTQEEIVGPLGQQIERSLEFFTEKAARVPFLEGAVRKLGLEYPITVIREVIVNALVHRDYQVSTPVFFQMYRDRIVVSSPGLPMKPLTIDMFPDQARSIPRNSRIAQAAFDMGYMEGRGIGIRTMPHLLKEYGLRDPEFQTDKGMFIVTLFGREATPLRITINSQTLAKLNARQLELLDFLEKRTSLTSTQWAEIGHISRQTAKADLEQLLRLGIARKRGIGKATSYSPQK